MNELLKLKEQRANLLAAAKEMLARAKARPDGQQDLTAEESAKVDEIYADFDKLGQRVATLERQSTLERAEAQLAEATRRTAPSPVAPHGPESDLTDAVKAWMKRGRVELSAEDLVNAQRAGIDLNSQQITIRYRRSGGEVVGVATGHAPIQRAMSNSGNTDLVAWREFFNGFEKYELYYGDVLNRVTRLKTDTGVTMPIPTFDDTSNRGRWLGEATTATATDPTTGSKTLGAFKASSDQIPVSIELLQDSQTTLSVLLPMLLGERIGRLKNQAITVGTGTTQPWGLVPRASNSAIVIGGTNASPTYSLDDFIDLKYSVDRAYRNGPADKRGYMFHDVILAKLRKLKDSQNRYFADPFSAGPGTIDGDPIVINNDVASTGVNAKVALYGDYSKYFFREVTEVTFYRLNEIKILDGQVVFLAIQRCDGDLINTSAVKYLKNPAS